MAQTILSAGDAFTKKNTLDARLLDFWPSSAGDAPKAGDTPHEGLLKVERREFSYSGLKFFGFRGWVFRVQGLGVFGLVWGLGFKGFKVFEGFEVLGVRGLEIGFCQSKLA